MQPQMSNAALDDLQGRIESVLLVAGEPVSIETLAAVVDAPHGQVREALEGLAHSLQGGIRLQVHAGAAQLVTSPEHADVIRRFLGTQKPAPLSRPALEVLSIVAYREPVTRAEIEQIRGVNSDRALATLVARGLAEERGRREAIGHPMQYGTGFAFLEYFGLSSMDELPPLEEAPAEVRQLDLGLRKRPS